MKKFEVSFRPFAEADLLALYARAPVSKTFFREGLSRARFEISLELTCARFGFDPDITFELCR
jgi:hypothetical protein